jgi:hypothetical protein
MRKLLRRRENALREKQRADLLVLHLVLLEKIRTVEM